MYLYYAKRKKDTAKVTSFSQITEASLRDEGYYTLVTEKLFKGLSLREIEKETGIKAQSKKIYVLGKKGRKKLIL